MDFSLFEFGYCIFYEYLFKSNYLDAYKRCSRWSNVKKKDHVAIAQMSNFDKITVEKSLEISNL